jgi:hypothetical protein
VLEGTTMSTRPADTQKRIAAVRSVASKLHAAEEALDLAIIKMCELNAELPAARLDANISATVSQAAFDLAARALKTLIRCRSQTVQTHEVLAKTQHDMGLGFFASGDAWKIFKTAKATPLTLIESVAA